jgi:hypothetical protein
LAGIFRGTRGLLGSGREGNLFTAPAATNPPEAPARQSWGWFKRLLALRGLPLGNRRKGRPWVQTEMLLHETHPLRHDLVEDDVELVRRPRRNVIYESQPVASVPRQLDTAHAYERLRNRAPLSERVVSN